MQSQSPRRPPSRSVMPGRFAAAVTRGRLPASGRPGQWSRWDGVGAFGATTRTTDATTSSGSSPKMPL